MFKNILTHNIFFPEYMGQGFIPTLQPTGSFFGLHQKKGGTYPQPLFKVFVFVFLPLLLSLSCLLQGEPPREGGQMALETDCKMATPTRFHFHQGLISSNVLYDVF